MTGSECQLHHDSITMDHSNHLVCVSQTTGDDSEFNVDLVVDIVVLRNTNLCDISDSSHPALRQNDVAKKRDKTEISAQVTDRELRDDFRLIPCDVITFHIDADLCGCVVHTLRRSSQHFWPGFLCYCRRYGTICTKPCLSSSVNNVHTVINLCAKMPSKQSLDFHWCSLMLGLVTKRMLLEEAMSWLNTLGGGYSALGEHRTQFAEEAGRISCRQLHIALTMGDPPTVMRCHLYYALSLMQRGFLKNARNIIRLQYQKASALPYVDRILLNVCHGMWNKLGYFWKKTKLTSR